MTPAVLWLVIGVPPSAFFPCTPGHSIEYLDSNGEKIVDTVRGPSPKREVECIVDRVTTAANGQTSRDPWVFETLSDRISNAGWLGSLTAFRPPLLVAPLTLKQRWHFNRTDFEVEAVDVTKVVKAGKFEGCVVIKQTPSDGSVVTRTTYAPNVGLIHVERGEVVREAVVVTVAPKASAPKKPSRSGK